MKIELTIKVDYLRNWHIWEGVRELLQNGRDARIEHQAPLAVSHRGKILTIKNDGCVLTHKDLLLGQTSKEGNSSLAGKFGEGLKLSVLALLRDGCKVRIRTGSEVWVPAIQKSDVFDGEDVLVFQIRKCKSHENAVTIEVQGIDAETWEGMRHKFLFLEPAADDDAVQTGYGTLLLDERYAGKVFVKGIFVGANVETSYGYDLTDAEVDRDRKMIQTWDLRWRLRLVWQEALNRRPDLRDRFARLLSAQREDVAGVDGSYAASTLPTEAVQYVAAQFSAQFGEDAVPVTSLGEAADVEHLGKKGVVVPPGLNAVLCTVMGTPEQRKESLGKETKVKHDWSSLGLVERHNLTEAIRLVGLSTSVSLNDIDVVDFRDRNLKGLYNDGRIQISRSRLADPDQVLLTLVHETAHREGEDGTKSHVSAIEDIWSGIVKAIRTSSHLVN